MKGNGSLVKQMMAMLLMAVLVIGMVVGTVPEEVRAANSDYEYSKNEDGTVTITKYKGSGGEVVIPNKIDGKTVTSIGEDAFYRCSNLTTVTIYGSVTSIGNFSFYDCDELTTVTIHGSVTGIGRSAFSRCDKLTTVTIHGSVISVGASAFCYCSSLTKVTIHGSVESIGDFAFFDCSNLTEITIPESVTSIGEAAFRYTNPNLKVTYGSCKHKWADVNKDESTLQTATKDGRVTYNPSVSMTEHEKVDATCTEAGYEVYYECSGCHGAYSDPNGENSITQPIIPVKGHTPAATVEGDRVEATCTQAGSYDEVVYCSVCKAEISRTAKTIEKKAHSYGGWTVTKQPTESEEGSKERSCSVCGYKQTEVIPKTGNTGSGDSTGKIEADKEQGKNAPDADFKTSKDELISAVLTPEEQSLVAAGTDIKIILDIDNIDTSVNASDKQAITDKADGYNVGQYLDINLYKIIGEDRTKVSQTNGKVKIALAIPDSLKNIDSAKTRSFAVVRVHNGVAEVLADLDNDEATITIETDLFSTYALVYKDTVDTDDNTANSQKDDEPKTGDITPIELYATLAMISGLSYLLLLFGNTALAKR